MTRRFTPQPGGRHAPNEPQIQSTEQASGFSAPNGSQINQQ
jgi:hypothetical protein